MKETIRGCALGLAIALIASVSMAQDIVGEWRADTPKGEMILTIAMGADGKLAGTMEGGWWVGEDELSDVEFEDGTLSVVSDFEFNGEKITIGYYGALEGNSIKGTLTIGDFAEFHLIANRSLAESISPESPYGEPKKTRAASVWTDQDLVGEWRADTPQGELIITIAMGADGTLAGTMNGGWWKGVNELSSVKFEGGELAVVNDFEFDGEDITIFYEGLLEGHSIDGVLWTGDFGRFPLVVNRSSTEPISPEGEWEISYEGRQGTRTATVKITKDSYGKLVGTWTTQRGENALSNVKIADGVLSFARHIEFNGNSVDFKYSATIDGNLISGTIDSGRFGARPFEGKRLGGGAGRYSAVAGTWNFSIESPQGPREIALELSEVDGQLTGTWGGPEGDMPIENTEHDDGDLTFDMDFDSPSGPFGVSFEARIFESSFYGKLTTPMTRGARTSSDFEFNKEELDLWSDGLREGNSVNGTRKTSGTGVSPLVVNRSSAQSISPEGEWEISYEGPQGPRTATVRLFKRIMSNQLLGIWTTRRGANALSNVRVAGSILSFARHIEFDGNSMDFTYSATIDGDLISGSVGTDGFGDRLLIGKRVGSGKYSMAVGNWYFFMETPHGSHEAAFQLSEVDGHLTGTWEGSQGVVPIENAEFYDGNLSFDINIDSPSGPFVLTFEAKVFYGSFYGKLTTPLMRGARTR